MGYSRVAHEEAIAGTDRVRNIGELSLEYDKLELIVGQFLP